MKTKEEIKVLQCVPYQLCPKCHGAKNVSTPCDICNGAGVISMHVINNNGWVPTRDFILGPT